MNPRRIALTFGATAAGLLAATILSAGTKADTYDYVIDPNSTAQLISVTGAPPAYLETSSYDVFDVDDTTLGTSTNPDVVGQFDAQQYTLTTDAGFSNDLIRVDYPFSGSAGLPPANSIVDTATFSNGFENVYTDLAGAGANGTNLITDTFNTPFGDFNVPTDFDAVEIIHSLLGTTT